MTAPSYLSGIGDEFLATIRDEAIKRAHPQRHAKLEAVRTAGNVAIRALEGVLHFVEQEIGGGRASTASPAFAA